MTLCKKNRKVREAGAEKARGRAQRIRQGESRLGLAVFIARVLPDFGGS